MVSSIGEQVFEQLIEHLHLEDFDVLLVGDGSGTVADRPCGWCVWSYVPGSPPERHLGGTNGGTNNYAELMPYIHALWSLLTRNPPSRTIRVRIVSDSEVTVRCGNRLYERRANAPLWAAVEWFERNGFELRWTHVRRNTNPVSEEADRVAGRVRNVLDGLG